MTREEAINQLKKLKSFYNKSCYGDALNFAIESIKVDVAYDLAYEKVDFIEIPDNATNGDMINAMFPNGKEYDNDGDVRYEIEIDFDYSYCSYFDGVWWNAPYKVESGE